MALPAAMEITIVFRGERVSGASGCNHFTGCYTLNDSRIAVGALATSLRACPPPRYAPLLSPLLMRRA